jgi:hypothetical protein
VRPGALLDITVTVRHLVTFTKDECTLFFQEILTGN